MTDTTDRRADATRRQILRAAAHQFAHRPYSLVSLDDILADAEVTKGAMYFHFRSKHALALAVIDGQSDMGREAVNELAARKLSGLETLIDASYLIALRDLTDEMARAGLNLLESMGRYNKLQANVLGAWINAFGAFVERAAADGDVSTDHDPADVGRLLVALYMGIRQTSNLDEPHEFLTEVEKTWLLVLPGFTDPQRMGYFTEFIKRRTALALNKVPFHTK
ncbi:MAG: TetR/AcrR family transcriptional regulator [Mycobacteriaceae bacterium]|nr:TetR/AcrR family transcriptional regulator [Mycobacteriaceae bacterium]